MKTTTRTNRDMIVHWRRVGPLLARIRRQELRAYDYKAHLPAIESLLEIACERARPRTTSGLVELQRLLAKLRR